MKIRVIAAGIIILGLLAGCATAPQLPIKLSNDSLMPTSGRVGVIVTTPTHADTNYPGAGCLLCLAVANINNNKLNTLVKTFSIEDLTVLKSTVVETLAKKGVTATIITDAFDAADLGNFKSTAPNIATKDFTPLQQKYNVDKLIVINIRFVGIERQYADYIPVAPPRATLYGLGYMVNLKTNAYEWYLPVNESAGAQGEWSEPPSFPGLTNAYYQVLEMTKDDLLKPLANSPAP